MNTSKGDKVNKIRERETERQRRGKRMGVRKSKREREEQREADGNGLRRVSPCCSLYFRASQTGLTAFPFGLFLLRFVLAEV